MRILMGCAPGKIFHIREFAAALSLQGVQCKVVIDTDIYTGFPSRRVSTWFQSANKANALFKEFEPDVVFVDRNGRFAKAALDSGLKCVTYLRGDYWSEVLWDMETRNKNPVRRVGRYLKGRIEEHCYQTANMIIPICNYLAEIVQKRYPDKPTPVLYQGIDHTRWKSDGHAMELKHPCVGLLQSANIWGKAREMLVLRTVLHKMPDVTFYWAGDGPYAHHILDALNKYDNFKWLGNLGYPDAVRRYLDGVDVYGLISGMDMSPASLLEAQLMEKPVLCTNVGGIPENMQDGTAGSPATGILVEPQNPAHIIHAIQVLLHDGNHGKYGRRYVKTNFNWNKIATDFIKIIQKC